MNSKLIHPERMNESTTEDDYSTSGTTLVTASAPASLLLRESRCELQVLSSRGSLPFE